ncbi:LysR substrate-binding domain-containing protein [Bordetella sp. N]|uniref:LysR substrate-binding domain-containing protein n=1 Tax=Bordetella sp. N TaxID=1746199 RepID=UPI00070B240B|nr:LysR substrate-binding domain-containing protein [Bordetella sp. N]ALM81982.1 LysR family transcriptional regulator [Bordetella sp. N]
MPFQRRFLPPIPVLMAFEAAARLQSFTAAAAELCITQGAVSRQIRLLEEQLGAPVFVRERQTVRLTKTGASYAREIGDALRRISNATLNFRANPDGGTLNLAILPTFGTRWLAPRLPDFVAAHPGITINLTTRLAPFDFNMDTVDAAIHHGVEAWSGAELDFLMHETVVPACSREFLAANAIARPADLLRVLLLHLATRPEEWRRWFEHHGLRPGDVPGMFMDQFAVAAQAAISGLGVALLPRFLIEGELERGDLVLACDAPMESKESYWLAWPSTRADYPPLQAFRAWLKAQAKD